MSRWSSSKAQTEPIAALVAVIIMAIALGLYSGVLTDVLTDRSGRSPEGVAIDRIWEDVSHDGVFSTQRDTGLDDIERDSLPDGQNVYVEVTTVDDDGEVEVVAAVQFGADGTRATGQEGPPEGGSGIETGVAECPVPVEDDLPGDVHGGTLRVEVWSP
ncbi:DUF7285 family protein [Natronorubrum halophilum]|uniref:DUF7285 family protein n=1 Tax=Natronorubrum halophilum TaxID=1702106 RepID=UPI0010C22E57|nr:hypothetical protein [Natronorubrum halophilum]